MVQALARNWWALALRGVLGILFGIAAFVWPSMTVAALVLLFGAYALVDGVFAIVTAFRGHTSQHRWVLALEGVLGVVAGLVAFLSPGITALALLYVIAGYAIITGIMEVIAAIRLRREIANEWMLALAGIASILFGLLMAAFPGAGALALVWMIAAYAIVFGILMLILAFRLRSHPAASETTAAQPSRP